MGTTKETLQIVNEIVYKGKGESRQLDRDLKTTEKQVKKNNISFEKMAIAGAAVTAGFAVLAKGVQQFYAVLKEGAAIEAAGLTFDNLAMSIGSTSDAMLTELRGATQSMVSDLDLMQFASQAVAMGLGSTSGEVAELAELGSVLGAAFRGDAVAGMEEFNLLLANQSIPRLDTFGISAGAVRTRIKELTEAFPDMGREAAFTQAVLEAGQVTMEKLGDNTDTAAVRLSQMDARLQNIQDELKARTTPAAIEFAEAILFITTSAEQLAETDLDLALKAIDTQITNAGAAGRSQAVSFLELRRATILYEDSLKELGDTFDPYRIAVAEVNELLEEAVREIGPRYGAFIAGSAEATDRMGDSHDQLAPAIRESTSAVEQFEDVVNVAAQRQAILAQNLALSEEATRQFNATLGDYFVEMSEAEDQTFDVNQELYDLVAAGDASAHQMAALAGELGIMSAAEAEAFLNAAILKGELMLLAEAVINGDVAMEDAAEAARALGDGLADSAGDAALLAENARLLKLALDDVPRNIVVSISSSGGVNVNSLTDPNAGTLTSATGNFFPTGGMSVVGEFGPELVNLPRGAQVVSTNQTRNITNNATFNANSRKGLQLMYQHLRRQSRPSSVLG